MLNCKKESLKERIKVVNQEKSRVIFSWVVSKTRYFNTIHTKCGINRVYSIIQIHNAHFCVCEKSLHAC